MRLGNASVSVLLLLAAAVPASAIQPQVPERLATIESGNAPVQEAPASAPVLSPLSIAMQERLAANSATKLNETEREDRAALAAFYDGRSLEPLWLTKTGLNEKGAAVVAESKRADDWGLVAKDFDLPDQARPQDGAELSDADIAAAETKLSFAVLRYARFARGGRIPDPTTQLSSYLDRKPQLKDPKIVLEEIAAASAADAYLRGLHPKHPQFEKLRQQYLAMREEAASRKPVVQVPKGPNLVPGKSHANVALLRQRLDVALPDKDGQRGDETFYDALLADAVKAFQVEKGIKPANGVVNKTTRDALNYVETASPRRLLGNMEEWRWMPEDMGSFPVWVNFPEFTIRVVKNGTVIHSERVITGKTDTQTPIFSDAMQTVVFHPFWGVPESIKVKEIWPSLARGGSMLERKGLRMQYNGRDVDPYSVDWSAADIRKFHVYQPPGSSNVLGVVKFLFPNKHQVYMHDTPTKNLFESSQRTFSHGCMRVRNPLRLAELVLGEDKGWDAGRINGLVKGGPQNNEVTLQTKVPVHVTYFTAVASDDGKVNFRSDFYGHEERITLALEGKWNQIVRGREHLAPVRAEPIAGLSSGFGYKPNGKGNSMNDFFKSVFGGF